MDDLLAVGCWYVLSGTYAPGATSSVLINLAEKIVTDRRIPFWNATSKKPVTIHTHINGLATHPRLRHHLQEVLGRDSSPTVRDCGIGSVWLSTL